MSHRVPPTSKLDFEPIFADPRSQELRALAERMATKDNAVLIVGPTGSGKEILARFLHERSARRQGPLVTVNCGAIPAHLFEAFFFGQVRGAFNDATNRDGYLTEADGGTLFLDEIGDLPLEHQVKLLRALDGSSYRPVGGSQDRTASIRFVAATNRDLESMIRDNRFREDLYARVSKLVLTVPPLRDRPGDVPALARFYASEHRPGDDAFAEIVAAAARELTEHPGAWPLGVRNVQAFAVRAEVYGVEAAARDMLDEWQRQGHGGHGVAVRPGPQPASLVVHTPPSTDDDRRALAHLIRAQLAAGRGKQRLAGSAGVAHALADLLFSDTRVEHARIQEALGTRDARTVRSNLQPLFEVGLLLEEGEHVMLAWPPVIVRLFLEVGDELRQIPPGYIPRAQSGDRLCVQITTQLPIEARVLVVSHRGTEVSEPVLVGSEFLASRQTKSISFELDDTTGLEQVFVHLSWARTRGVKLVASKSESFLVPAPQVLKRQRMNVLEALGPGWLQEYLVHHL